MGNCCCVSPAADAIVDTDPLPFHTTIVHVNPDISSTGETTCQFDASTNFTWLSQVSNSTENNQRITSHEIAYAAGKNLRVFTYAQLKIATHNFRRDRIIGRGGFGKVYKGGLKVNPPSHGFKRWMPSQPPQKLVFAVKQLDSSSKQGQREWLSEVNILGALSHPNLVKLLGYSTDNQKFFLVYDFMPNGSLNYHLFGKGSVLPLPWDKRFQIVLGMGRGLVYLHTADLPIIHRDFKSSNVLLDKLFNAKLSDFGLASLADKPNSKNRGVAGTLGYMSPELCSTGHATVKSDVYGFGIVAVEILTGLRAVDNKRPSDQTRLVSWIKPQLANKRKLKSIMDPKLEGKYPYKEASQIAMLALRCLNDDPRIRPSMNEVVETLEQLKPCQK